MDTFIDLLSQGQFLRFVIIIFVIFVLFIINTTVAARDRRRQLKAKEQGQPNPPSSYVELWRYLMSQLNNTQEPEDEQEDTPSTMDDDAEVADNENAQRDIFEDLPMPAFDFKEPDPTPLVDDIDSFLSDLDEDDYPEEISASAMNVQNAPVITGEVVNDSFTDSNHEYVSVPLGTDPERSGFEFVPYSGAIPVDAGEIIRIWRDMEDGSLIMQMGDRLFQTVPELRDRGMAKRFISLVQDLAQLATIGAEAAGLPKPDFNATSDVFSQPGAWSKKNTQTVNTTLSQPDVPVAPTPKEEKKPETGSLGIVSQINRYLQQRLSQTPIFASREIKMTNKPDGSLLIFVDKQQYDAIGEIEDREVRQFMQMVINEWEERGI